METFFKTLETHPQAAIILGLFSLAVLLVIRFKIADEPKEE